MNIKMRMETTRILNIEVSLLSALLLLSTVAECSLITSPHRRLLVESSSAPSSSPSTSSSAARTTGEAASTEPENEQRFDLRRFLQALIDATRKGDNSSSLFEGDLHRVPSSPNPIQNEFTDEVHH